MDKDLIAKKINEYREKRDQLFQQAQQQLAAFDGAIEALTGLLNEPDSAQPSSEPEQAAA